MNTHKFDFHNSLNYNKFDTCEKMKRKVSRGQEIKTLRKAIHNRWYPDKIFKQEQLLRILLMEETIPETTIPETTKWSSSYMMGSLKDTLNIRYYEEAIYKWIDENQLCKNIDKKNYLFWEIFRCIYNADIGLYDFNEIVKTCSENNITIDEGNMWENLEDYFKVKHIIFLKLISETCPRALSSSPNADCGKFELLYRLLRPESRQPNKGDIVDNGEKLELKGKQIRLFSDKTGKQYIKDTNKLFINQGIEGNKVKSGGLKGSEQYEIEKTQYREHYNKQFCKDIVNSHRLIKQYLQIHKVPYTESDIKEMFEGDEWHQYVLQKLWLKKMYILTMEKNGADKMIIFGDGTNVKILDSIDKLENFEIYDDYFRINKDVNIGYYII